MKRERNFWVKVTRTGDHILVAVCDEDLIGKRLMGRGLCVEIREEFYKGRRLGSRDAVETVKCGTVVNLIGNNIVGLAIKQKLVHQDAVMKIAKVAHAQIVKI